MSGPRSSVVRLWTALNLHPKHTFFSLVILCLAVSCTQAATRLVWGDELITLAVARTGSLQGIWDALTLGADPNPPLSHAAVLWSTRIFGTGALALRLPSIAAMLVAIACLWALLRRWVEPGYAAIGVLAFMATRGFDYSYESRSYAPLAGATMAALLCWLRAVAVTRAGTRRRMGWLAAMALCLALAVSSNYYGVLAWSPIVAGEITRYLKSRRTPPGVWIALAAGALPLLAYLPLIRRNIAEFTPHAWNRPHLSMVGESYLLLVEGVFWPVLAGALWLWRLRRSPAAQPSTSPGRLRTLQAHEAVALGVLLAYPVLGFVVALGGAGMVSPRCVLPVCCGFGLAAGLIAASVLTKPRAAVLACAIGTLWVAARQASCAVLLYQQRISALTLIRQIAQVGPGAVYVADSSFVLPLAYYGGPELRGRLVFPIDFAAIHAVEPDDSGEQNLWAGRHGLFPFAIVPYTSALAHTRPALVIARPDGWLWRALRRDDLPLTDETTPADAALLRKLGGVFTPILHPETRLLIPER